MAGPGRGSLAREIAKAVGAPRAVEFHFGVVQATATSPNSVTLTLDGASTHVAGIRYLASYTPTVGDTVIVALLGTDNRLRQQWVAVGKLA